MAEKYDIKPLVRALVHGSALKPKGATKKLLAATGIAALVAGPRIDRKIKNKIEKQRARALKFYYPDPDV